MISLKSLLSKPMIKEGDLVDTVNNCRGDVTIECQVEPVISEPVISFIKVIQSNPKRFKLCDISVDGGWAPYGNNRVYHHQVFRLVDNHTKEFWNITERKSIEYLGIKYIGGDYAFKEKSEYVGLPEFLTKDEKDELIRVVGAIFRDKKNKLKTLKDLRKARVWEKERNRLTKIYQGEI